MTDREVATLAAGTKAKKRYAFLDDRFGRTGTRVHIAAKDGRGSAKAGEQIVSAELQDWLGNAYLQIANPPENEMDARILVAALNGVVEHLKDREVASTFAFAPVTDLLTNAAMLASGFRKTGLLAEHLPRGRPTRRHNLVDPEDGRCRCRRGRRIVVLARLRRL